MSRLAVLVVVVLIRQDALALLRLDDLYIDSFDITDGMFVCLVNASLLQ
jgi:hypothetical protein